MWLYQQLACIAQLFLRIIAVSNPLEDTNRPNSHFTKMQKHRGIKEIMWNLGSLIPWLSIMSKHKTQASSKNKGWNGWLPRGTPMELQESIIHKLKILFSIKIMIKSSTTRESEWSQTPIKLIWLIQPGKQKGDQAQGFLRLNRCILQKSNSLIIVGSISSPT